MADSNALKFTPNGGDIQVKSYFIPESVFSSESGLAKLRRLDRVYTTTANQSGKIRIEFLDTGPGISDVSTIFWFCNTA
jgi:signal transduction histidine kinase